MTTNTALINRSSIDQIVRCNAHAGRASWIQNSRPKALDEAMQRDEDFQSAHVPFDGFYNSYLTAAFDDAVNDALSYYEEADDCERPVEELEVTASWGSDTVQLYQRSGETSGLKGQLTAAGEL